MIYHSLSGGDIYDLAGLPEVVEAAVEKLRDKTHLFDSIVATGMSGVTVASPVALGLGVPLVIVRKPNDGSHHSHSSSSRLINAAALGERALFLDDFVASGDTRKRVEACVSARKATVVGEYMYAGNYTNTWAGRAELRFEAST